MDKATEIQLRKSILGNIMSRTESSFMLGILNISGSIPETIKVMESYSTLKKTSDVIVENFTLKQHIELSSIVLSKIKKVKLDMNDIDSILSLKD